MTDWLLEIEDLQVQFTTARGVVQAVRGASLSMAPGECLGLVGESGSGKSVTALAMLGLIEPPGRVTGGVIRWRGETLPHDSARLHALRGRKISIVFQDPMISLNPLLTVGAQISEVIRRHESAAARVARQRAVELLDLVQIAAPARRALQYPHELSGGMRQRVMIAMALACTPDLLIADEPTTALDVTIQAQILDLIDELRSRLGLAVLLITHDMGVVAGLSDRVAVMYAGRVVEIAQAEALFARPAHPYAASLLRATPRLDLHETQLFSIEGSPPDMLRPPPACAFAERCPAVVPRCRADMPVLIDIDDREVACWRPFALADAPRAS